MLEYAFDRRGVDAAVNAFADAEVRPFAAQPLAERAREFDARRSAFTRQPALYDLGVAGVASRVAGRPHADGDDRSFFVHGLIVYKYIDKVNSMSACNDSGGSGVALLVFVFLESERAELIYHIGSRMEVSQD